MGTAVLSNWGRPVVPGHEQATVRLTTDAGLEIRVGTHSHGQGHETTLAQVAHEILGIEFERIKVLQGDTLYCPFSTGTWGSRSIVMAGGAVAEASRLLGERAKRIGAWLLQAEPSNTHLANGRVHASGASVGLREIARAWYLQPQNLPPDVDRGGLEVTAGYRPAHDAGTFSYATHAALVAVDVGSGHVAILDYVVVEDGGKLVNAMIVMAKCVAARRKALGHACWKPCRSMRTASLWRRACSIISFPARPKCHPSGCCTWKRHLRIPNLASRVSAKAAPSAPLPQFSAPSMTPCARSARKCTICRSRPCASCRRFPPAARHTRNCRANETAEPRGKGRALLSDPLLARPDSAPARPQRTPIRGRICEPSNQDAIVRMNTA